MFRPFSRMSMATRAEALVKAQPVSGGNFNGHVLYTCPTVAKCSTASLVPLRDHPRCIGKLRYQCYSSSGDERATSSNFSDQDQSRETVTTSAGGKSHCKRDNKD